MKKQGIKEQETKEQEAKEQEREESEKAELEKAEQASKELEEAEKAGQEELLPLTNDYVFRRVFGHMNVDALADFLAEVLEMPPGELSELTVDDPHLHSEYKGGKSGILDVRVHTKSKKIINVEIHIRPGAQFRNRIVYYNDRIFSGQLIAGEDYIELHRAISVVITDDTFIKENDDYFNRFWWYNPKNRTLLTDAQEINTLELIKLPESSDDTKLWEWMKFIKSKEEEEMEALAENNEAMKDVMATLRKMSADPVERRLAEAREMEILDRITAERSGEIRGIEIGMEQGIEIGKEQGIEVGEARATEAIARNLKKKGFSAVDIADATGLAEEEIAAL